MRKTFWIVPVLLLMNSMAVAQTAAGEADAATKPQTKKELLAYFDQTRDNLLKKVNGLTEAQWKFKPAPDRWSVAEVVEHVTVTEQMLQGMIKKGLETPVDAAKKSTRADAGIEGMVTDRSKKFQAPDPVKPTGRFATKEAAIEAFSKARAGTFELAKETPEQDLRAHVADSPGGPMDLHQFLMFTAGHSARHTKQIEEVLADPNFPKK